MKTAIVEISESHEECIYSQLCFLKDAGHEVTLIVHKKLENQITAYADLANNVSFFDFERVSSIQKLRMQWHLFTLLKKFDLLILNTAHSYSVIRNVSVLLRFVKTKCIGVLHNTKKLQRSKTQRIISKKVKHYFVLNDALLPGEVSDTIKVQSFYPIFFPKYEKVPVYKQNQIWIGIPGRIDYKRRDFDFLINALKQANVSERIKFLVLGKVDPNTPDGNRLIESIEKSGKLKNFKLFHAFIDNPEFHAYLSACDYIMPLLRPDQDYLGSKISGAFNLAFAHKKPMLCNSFFDAIPDLRKNSLFYDTTSFNQLLADIDDGNAHPPTSYSDTKWNYKFQQSRYIAFINE